MTTAKDFVHECVEYLSVMAVTGQLPPEKVQSTIVQQKDLILDRLRRSRTSRPDATLIMKELQQSPFTLPQRSEILTVLTAMVGPEEARLGDQSSLPGSIKGASQSCLSFHRLVKAVLWGIMRDETKSFSSRVDAMVRFMVNELGLSWPNETTLVHCVATFIMAGCRSEDDAFLIEPNDAFTILRDLKSGIKNLRSKGGIPHWGRIIVYPNTLAEFESKFPDVFQVCYPGGRAEVPEQCPISESKLEQLRLRLPARSTHSSVSAARPLRSQGPSFASAATAQLSMQMMNSMMAAVGQRMLPALPGIPPQTRGRDLPAIGDGTPLESRAEEPQQTEATTEKRPDKDPEQQAQQQLPSESKNIADMAQSLLQTLGPKKPEKKVVVQVASEGGKSGGTSLMKRPAGAAKLKYGGGKCLMKRPAGAAIATSKVAKLPCPGKPTKTRPPFEHKSLTIVTDIASQCWRVKRGSKLLRCASFATDHESGWQKVLTTIEQEA